MNIWSEMVMMMETFVSVFEQTNFVHFYKQTHYIQSFPLDKKLSSPLMLRMAGKKRKNHKTKPQINSINFQENDQTLWSARQTTVLYIFFGLGFSHRYT